ncbi:type I restriction endonuclease subunit R [Hymenobacter terrenus]|uniref:type I restriction endonuclease subunit R n=1 Tax=Hymenobacter terrenus TaxID=1629124 RepID=UPI000619F2D4|nr:type I restriction endonuclease subunit R [Hymenobacter terrenus]
MLNEHSLEEATQVWFQETGWQVADSATLLRTDSPNAERADDARQVLLPHRLLQALARLNPGLPVSALEEAAALMARLPQVGLTERNQEFQKLLTTGVPVEVRDADGHLQPDRVWLVDFREPERNDWLVVRQLSVRGAQELRRPDMVAYLNGLPIAVLELKSPLGDRKKTDVWDAYNQLEAYKHDIPDLFVTNAALVVSDGFTARIGSLTADRDRYMPWRTLRDEADQPLLQYELEKVVRGFFDRELLLDYLRHFILFEPNNEGVLIKKIAAYHQFHAVREAVKATLTAAALPGRPAVAEVHEPRASYGRRVVPGSRKGGIVWHTQGSGKSISMACFAGKLMGRPELGNPTLVIVTDRNDLDGQLYQQFVHAKALLGEDPKQAEDREHLRTLLADRPAGGIFFTTIQKFSLLKGEEQFPALSGRGNLVVIVDEAHRTQYGLEAHLNQKTGRYQYGYAKHMRDALPQATFVGFTGTPLDTTDKSTREVFGDYVSIYDIQDAVRDGATVPIIYESRVAKLEQNQKEIARLNTDVEEVFEDEEDKARRDQAIIKWTKLEKLAGAQPRLAEIAADLVQHFEQRQQILEGKGMVVAMSRDICVRLYDEIIKLRPTWHDTDPLKGRLKVVMTGSAADDKELRPHIYSAGVRKAIEKRFKNAADELQLVIVRDMWLTGFDVPSLHTMYLDKPMRDHNLMQAIARVNRVFGEKQGGLIVDYISVAQDLKKALRTYADNNGKGTPTTDAHVALGKLLEAMEACRSLLRRFNYAAYETQAMQLLPNAANFVLSLEKPDRKAFFDAVLSATKAFSLCGTLDEAKPLRTELAFLQAVRSVILKATTPERRLSEYQQQHALKQLLDGAVVSGGLEDVFKLAGLDQPELSIFSDKFLADVAYLPQQNLALALLQKLLNDQIKSRLRNNVVQERLFSERLADALNKYHNRFIESAQVIVVLIDLARELREAATRGEKLKMRDDELAFYDALNDNASAGELSDDVLRQIALELTEKLRKNASIDWQKRESVRARLRNLVRITLRRHHYPPDKQEDAIALVMQQAERLAEQWA